MMFLSHQVCASCFDVANKKFKLFFSMALIYASNLQSFDRVHIKFVKLVT